MDSHKLGHDIGRTVNTGVRSTAGFYRGQTRGGKVLVWYSVAITLLLLLSLLRHSSSSPAAASSGGSTSSTSEAQAAANTLLAKYEAMDRFLVMHEVDEKVHPYMGVVGEGRWDLCKQATMRDNYEAARGQWELLMEAPQRSNNISHDITVENSAIMLAFYRKIGGDPDRKMRVNP